jgi:hypothetical protein
VQVSALFCSSRKRVSRVIRCSTTTPLAKAIRARTRLAICNIVSVCSRNIELDTHDSSQKSHKRGGACLSDGGICHHSARCCRVATSRCRPFAIEAAPTKARPVRREHELCQRCSSRAEPSGCVYGIHTKHAKEDLVKQTKQWRAEAHLTEQILRALSTDERVTEILHKLRNGEAYETIVGWLGRSTIEGYETMPSRATQHSIYGPGDQGTCALPVTSWTSVLSDNVVLDHLFQLYFTWVHPVHTLFSEERFVDSYRRQPQDYCSSSSAMIAETRFNP